MLVSATSCRTATGTLMRPCSLPSGNLASAGVSQRSATHRFMRGRVCALRTTGRPPTTKSILSTAALTRTRRATWSPPRVSTGTTACSRRPSASKSYKLYRRRTTTAATSDTRKCENALRTLRTSGSPATVSSRLRPWTRKLGASSLAT